MKIKKLFLKTFSFILLLWLALTVWVEWSGDAKMDSYGNDATTKTALLVYDPDPFYNLDEKVCTSFAKGLSESGWLAKVQTVAAATERPNENFDLYVFCANTYNFAPDRAMKNFIKNHNALNTKPIVAITLGSGSTERAQRILENLIKEKGGNLLASKSFWLLRPNDQTRMEESNVVVAVEMAKAFGKEMAKSTEELFSQN